MKEEKIAEESGVDLTQVVQVFRKRLWMVIVVTLVVVTTSILYTLRQPKIYQASTTIQIETQAPKVLGNEVEDVVTLGTGSYWSNQEYYETQYKIIESREVAERVVRTLNLNSDPDFLGVPPELRGAFKPATVTDAALKLKGMLSVEPVKDSRLVRISIVDTAPARARLLANAIANAYIDQNLEQMLSSTVSALDWLSNQQEELRGKLERSENALYSFKKTQDVLSVSLEDRQNILAKEIEKFTENLTEVRSRCIELKAQRDQIRQVAENVDPLAMPIDILNQNGLIQSFKAQYANLQLELAEISERYLDKHPRILELQAKMKRIQNDIRREVDNILSAVDSEYETARRNEQGLVAVIENLKNQAQDLGQKEIDYNRLKREKDNNERLYQILQGRTKETDLSRLLKVNNIRILDSATLPSSPIKPQPQLAFIMALLVGLALGVALIFLLEYLDKSVKGQEQIEKMGLTILGLIPSITVSDDKPIYGSRRKKSVRLARNLPVNDRDLIVHRFPKSTIAESCRAIRTNILFMSTDDPIRRILVTSPSPKEGKTTVAISLSIIMAQSGSKVLLIDTDMRKPRLHRSLSVPKDPGLSHFILGEADLGSVIYPTEIPNLSLIPCGPPPPNPAEILHTDRFHEAVNAVSSRFDHIIFDSPPLGVVTDAAILSRLVDGTLFVIKPGFTSKDALKYVATTLNDIGSRTLGVVLNDMDPSSRSYNRYSYYYYYQYRHGHDDDRPSTSNDPVPTPPVRENRPQTH